MTAHTNVGIERLARLALEQFGLGPEASIRFAHYRENHVFHVGANGQTWALKLHRPGYRTDQEIVSEATILESLAASGVRVVEPVRGPRGSHLARVPRAGSEASVQQATLQRWVDGASPMGSSPAVFDGLERPDPERVRELGRLMGRLHAHAEREGRPEGYERPAWDAAGLVGPDALWGAASELSVLDEEQRDLLRRAEERLGRELAGLDRSRRRYGPIHADLTVENVLIDGEGLILIDFDDSGEGWYLFDLATTYFFCSHHPESAAILGELMDGYRQERPITAADLPGWHPLLMARALTYLAWSVDRPGDPTSEYHERVLLPWILDAAQRFVDTGSTGWDEPDITGHSAPGETPTEREQ